MAVWQFHRQVRITEERSLTASRQNAELRYELKQARERGEDLAQKLAQADTQLGSAKTRATATETRSAQLTRELTSARAILTEREQREVALLAQLEELRQLGRAEIPRPVEAPSAAAPVVTRPAAATPAPATVAAPPVDVGPYERRIAALEAQLVEVLTRALADLPAAPVEPPPAVAAVTLPQVVQVGARDAFVVIDRGSEHGVNRGDVCAIMRDGTELALGRLSDVRPRFSVVHLLPGSLKGQLQAGDIAVLAR